MGKQDAKHRAPKVRKFANSPKDIVEEEVLQKLQFNEHMRDNRLGQAWAALSDAAGAVLCEDATPRNKRRAETSEPEEYAHTNREPPKDMELTRLSRFIRVAKQSERAPWDLGLVRKARKILKRPAMGRDTINDDDTISEAIQKAEQIWADQIDAHEKERGKKWHHDMNCDDAKVIRWIRNYKLNQHEPARNHDDKKEIDIEADRWFSLWDANSPADMPGWETANLEYVAAEMEHQFGDTGHRDGSHEWRPFTGREMRKLARKMGNTAAGPDAWTASSLVKLSEVWWTAFALWSNRCRDLGQGPGELARVRMVLIPKGDGTRRPITIADVAWRVFAASALERFAAAASTGPSLGGSQGDADATDRDVSRKASMGPPSSGGTGSQSAKTFPRRSTGPERTWRYSSARKQGLTLGCERYV